MRTTRYSYIGNRIKPQDEIGFRSSGFCLYQKTYGINKFLLANETRKGITRYNFLGGKRVGNETPLETARRELREEMTIENKLYLPERLLTQIPLDRFFWNGEGFILFLMEMNLSKEEIDRISGMPIRKFFTLEEMSKPKVLHDFSAKYIHRMGEFIGN